MAWMLFHTYSPFTLADFIVPARFGQLGLILSCSVNTYRAVLRGPETCWPRLLQFAVLARFGSDVLCSVNSYRSASEFMHA